MKTISPNLKKLASILSDNEYHSGTEIGDELGLTRSGIWKLVKQLEMLGIVIESVTNKGYRLTQPLEFLVKTKMKKHISPSNLKLLDELMVYDEVTSTNDLLVAHAKQHKDKNAACLAEQQTAGRGRLGRQWISPFAANIYFSLLWHFDCDISELAGLNIVVGVSVAQAIFAATTAQNIKLKWPNDIYWQDRKLGGILIDIVGEFSGGCATAIGIGINVNMPQSHADQIQKPWTDLNTASGQPVDRNKLAGILLDKLITNLSVFQHKGIAEFINAWNDLDYLSGRETSVKSIAATVTGIAQGINEQGHLLLKMKDGTVTAITTGDASITYYG